MSIKLSEIAAMARATRYESAKKWAGRRTREELEHAVAMLFARQVENIGQFGKDALSRRRARTATYQRTLGYWLKGKVTGTAGAIAKLKNDPVQSKKPQARELWDDWQTGKTKHTSGAAFDRYVLEQISVIHDTKTVYRWRKEWGAAAEK